MFKDNIKSIRFLIEGGILMKLQRNLWVMMAVFVLVQMVGTSYVSAKNEIKYSEKDNIDEICLYVEEWLGIRDVYGEGFGYKELNPGNVISADFSKNKDRDEFLKFSTRVYWMKHEDGRLSKKTARYFSKIIFGCSTDIKSKPKYGEWGEAFPRMSDKKIKKKGSKYILTGKLYWVDASNYEEEEKYLLGSVSITLKKSSKARFGYYLCSCKYKKS